MSDIVPLNPFAGLLPMKVMDRTDERAMKEYLSKPPEKTHTKEELDSLYRAIRFTKIFKQEESLAKMDEESAIQHLLPGTKIRDFV